MYFPQSYEGIDSRAPAGADAKKTRSNEEGALHAY